MVQDGLDAVVKQIITVCSEPEVLESGHVFSQSTGKSGLREKCLGIIRGGNAPDWRKFIDELQNPIEQQLLKWKEDSEKTINQGEGAWKSIVLKATDICLPGFVPLFASVEVGQKEHWKDATRILRRLAILEDKMLAGTIDIITIGHKILYLPGSIGMAIAIETGQHDLLWDWMLMPIPNYRHSTEIRWIDIREAFWPPVVNDFKDPFRFLLDLYHSEFLQGFFSSEERMKEFLFKANLLQSIVELRLLTRAKEGVEKIEKQDKLNINVLPMWCLVETSNFRSWALDLFGSSEGFIRFFTRNSNGRFDQKGIWNLWKSWKKICESFIYQLTNGKFFPRPGWLMLPGKPVG